MVGARGFEPPTTCTPCMYATRLRYAPTMFLLKKQKALIIADKRYLTKYRTSDMCQR